MIGALILAFVVVVVLPVAFLMTGGLVTVLMGWWLKKTVEEDHQGSELVDLYY